MAGAVTGALVGMRKDRSSIAAARTGCGKSGRVNAASTSAISGARPVCFATASRTIAVTAACKACFGATPVPGKTDCTAAGRGLMAKSVAFEDLTFSTPLVTLAAGFCDAGFVGVDSGSVDDGNDGDGDDGDDDVGNDGADDCGGSGVSKIFGCAIVPSTEICTRVPCGKG
jgi:hypothetical protein